MPGYEPTRDAAMQGWFDPVTPGYLAATSIGLRRGRDLDARDLDRRGTPGSETPAVVSDAFARRYFPRRDPNGVS